jgi:hypothetical protein
LEISLYGRLYDPLTLSIGCATLVTDGLANHSAYSCYTLWLHGAGVSRFLVELMVRSGLTEELCSGSSFFKRMEI